MSMDDKVEMLPPPPIAKASGDVELLAPPSKAKKELTGASQAAARGLAEAVPFYGEEIATKAGLPEPTDFTQRLTRRAARNLPYALAAGATGVGAVPAAMGFVGSTALGQIAEEMGVPKEYQPVAEIAGSAVPQAARDITGRVIGYIQEPLKELSKKASKAGFYVGPGARAEQGMKYGAGENPEQAIENLNKFTKEATIRAGSKTDRIDSEWIKTTGEKLGNEVARIFAGKTFQSNPTFIQNIDDIVLKGESTFGDKGNVVRTIIEKNISGGKNARSLLSPTFKAEDLRGAITDVNAALGGASGPQARLLHDLKDSLEDIAKYNLEVVYQRPDLAKQYDAWRKSYNSYASINDVFQLEGKSGVTGAGQLNPKAVLDEVVRRTGGKGTRNPLYENLAEFGKILKFKEPQKTGAVRGTIDYLTESPLAKGLQSILQPYYRAGPARAAATAQTLSPAQQYFQGILPSPDDTRPSPLRSLVQPSPSEVYFQGRNKQSVDRATFESAAKAGFGAYEPNKYKYGYINNKLYRQEK